MDQETKQTQPAQGQVQSPRGKLLFVMVIVFIICGGNALGIFSGFLIWRFTGKTIAAVLALVGMTLLALILALVVALAYFRSLTGGNKPEN